MAIVLRCPECREKFKWDFSDKKRWPKECPACDAEMGGDADDNVICMPSLKGAATSRIDASYRELETSSEARMYEAAEAAGCSPSEMSGIKVTDIKTGVKPGESYAPSVAAETARLAVGGTQPGFQGADAVHLAAQVRSGPHPNAGANTLSRIQRLHGH